MASVEMGGPTTVETQLAHRRHDKSNPLSKTEALNHDPRYRIGITVMWIVAGSVSASYVNARTIGIESTCGKNHQKSLGRPA